VSKYIYIYFSSKNATL